MVKQREGMGMNWVINRLIKNRVTISTNEKIKGLSWNLLYAEAFNAINPSIHRPSAWPMLLIILSLGQICITKQNFLVISNTFNKIFSARPVLLKDFAPQ